MRRYADQLQVLHEIDRAILAASSAAEVADVTLSRLGDLVPYNTAIVELFDFDSNRAQNGVSRHAPETQGRRRSDRTGDPELDPQCQGCDAGR